MIASDILCPHAGPWSLTQLRPCFHPEAVGQQFVTRDHCRRCDLRLASVLNGHLSTTLLSPHLSVERAAQILELHREGHPHFWWTWPNVQAAFRLLVDRAIAKTMPYPSSFSGRGIVIVGGGKYFPSAYVTMRVLRHLGCQLPIELWHFASELDVRQRALVTQLGGVCVDGEARAAEVGYFLHESWWRGWQLKPLAILGSSFGEVLYLDADCYPTRDPTFLFEEPSYHQCGAIFWPDLAASSCVLPQDAHRIFGTAPLPDRPAESGQLLIDKRRCWRELNLTLFYNRYAEFTYRILWGDKDTFPLAWRRLGTDYARLWPTAGSTPQAILQYDADGRVLFQHRAPDKFRLPNIQFESNKQSTAANVHNPQLVHEDFCFAALAELCDLLDVNPTAVPPRIVCKAPLQFLQICPTLGTACGVANFAIMLEQAMRRQGVELQTVREIPSDPAAPLLIQHEFGIFETQRLARQLAACRVPKMLFAHSPGAEQLAALVEGTITMAPGMLRGSDATFLMPHPANIGAATSPEVKRELGLANYSRVIGTCGFLTLDRELEPIVTGLLRIAVRHNWFIYLICPPHAHHGSNSANVELEGRLLTLAGPHLRLEREFLSADEQARRLAALDLAWCWTRVPSRPYASGVASDLYGSGARLVVQHKQQHAAVLGRENVRALRSESVGDLILTLREEAQRPPTRHDPADLSWDRLTKRLVEFLRTTIQ